MHITIFGASGRVGQLVTSVALSDGHNVTAFVHSSDPFKKHAKLSVVKGTVTDYDAVLQAIKGSDAVISTLGSWNTTSKTVVSDGAKIITRAMQELQIRRIILLTGSGAYWSGDTLRPVDTMSHLLLKVINAGVLSDGEAAVAELEVSNLDWTALRAPAMKDGECKSYKLNNVIGHPLQSVTRPTVARAIIDQLNNSEWIQKTPVIH